MNPIFLTIRGELALRIIPDSIAHVDGHPILTRSYSIYNDTGKSNAIQFKKEEKLHLEKKDDPDYRGEIIFEKPGRFYRYVAEDEQRLDIFEIQELVEKLSEYRDDPSNWNLPEF
jgi:hypothetical protein